MRILCFGALASAALALAACGEAGSRAAPESGLTSTSSMQAQAQPSSATTIGGSSGTTRDAFTLLEEAKKHGARAALFGRKINNSEHQLTFVRFLHAIANSEITAEEAVKAYHGELEKLKIPALRPLRDDLQRTTTATSYAGATRGVGVPPARKHVLSAGETPTPRKAVIASPSLDFSKMSSADKVAYARQRLSNPRSKIRNAQSA